MEFKDALAGARKSRNLTQEQLAAKLYVTRQAVSRWERGEVVPGIDMTKLIATVLDVPITTLLDMPEHFCHSCGMIITPGDCGTDADGNKTDHYCKWCYDQGEYTYETTMDAMIEDCAPRLAENTGMTRDEAVSLMGAVLPTLERWSAAHSNEARYGAEARGLYGEDEVDAMNERLLKMGDEDWKDLKDLEPAVIEQLCAAMASGDPAGPAGKKLVGLHRAWVGRYWGREPERDAYLGLVHGYLADERFVSYYDGRAGDGATEFLARAVEARLA